MKHLITALFSAILFITGIYSLYKPLGRELIPRIAPFFIGDKGIWGTIKNIADPEADEIIVTNINSEVKISRDKAGIPHIYANNYDDALFALGYISARDRMIQIEYFNRLVAGESADWFGGNNIEIDKFMLSLGLDKAAWDTIYRIGNTEEYNLLLTYSKGINSYINNEFEKIPPFEYSLLGIPNRYHRPVDAIRTLYLYHYLMNWNMNDFNIQQIVDKIGSKDFIDIFYHQLTHLPKVDGTTKIQANRPAGLNPLKKLYGNTFELLQKQKDQFENVTGLKSSSITSNTIAKFSNNTSYLTTDIHGPLTQPSLFYEVYLHYDKKIIHGFTIPGIPGILFGSNGSVSWTNNYAPVDVVDYAIIPDTLNIAKEMIYEIKVRESSNVTYSVKFTANGVLMNAGSEYIEMRWSAFNNQLFATGLRNALNATTMDDLFKTFSKTNLPVMQVVGIDKNGPSYFLSGQIPKRKSYLGIIDATVEPKYWDGYLQPQLYSYPKSEKVVYSNNYPWNEGSEYYPFFSVEGQFRTIRLNELVNQLNIPIKISEFEGLTRDVLMQEQDLKPLLSDLFKGKINSPVNALGNQLRAWDFLASKDATYPKFFTNLEKLAKKVTFDEFPNRLYPDQELIYEMILTDPQNKFFDIQSTSTVETGKEIFEKIFNDAYELTVLESGSSENWTWAVTNKGFVKHITNNKILNSLNSLVVARDGYINTVFRSDDGVFPISSSLRFTSTLSASSNETKAISFTGNSANRYSPFFQNQLSNWLNNDLRSPWSNMPFDSMKVNGYLIIKPNE